MKIALFPMYPEWAASSRLRVYTLATALAALGHDAVIGGSGADITLIQKACSWQQRPDSKLVIFDCDDLECYARIPDWCDVVTTDTEGHAEGLRAHTTKPVEVVPDPIDFCPAPAPLPRSTGSGAVWFGHRLNYNAAVEHLLNGALIAGERVRVISHADLAVAPGIELVPWDYSTFVNDLRKSAYAILSHEGADPGKSNNKMICAITLGLDVLVSNTPEYGALWQEVAGLTFEQSQNYVWEHYHPQQIARQWLNVMRRYM